MITLPPDAIPYIRQQRTKLAPRPAEEVQAAYAAEIEASIEQLRPFLPPAKPDMRFVDIGCGIGFGLLVLRSVYGPEHRFVGIDRGIPTPKISYGFSETPAAYNSLQLTRDTLIAAGVSGDRIQCIDIDHEPFPSDRADIVTSTLAWGFHFPVQAYLDEVKAVLAPDGVLIIDVRNDVGQEAMLLESFDVVRSWPGPKANRLILKRKPA